MSMANNPRALAAMECLALDLVVYADTIQRARKPLADLDSAIKLLALDEIERQQQTEVPSASVVGNGSIKP